MTNCYICQTSDPNRYLCLETLHLKLLQGSLCETCGKAVVKALNHCNSNSVQVRNKLLPLIDYYKFRFISWIKKRFL